jgi:hypothetical protein
VFFDVPCHYKKTPFRNYPILRGEYLLQRLKDFQVKVSLFTIMTTQTNNCTHLGKLKNCLTRHGKLKKFFFMKDTSRNLTNEMKGDVTFENPSTRASNSAKRVYMN